MRAVRIIFATALGQHGGRRIEAISLATIVAVLATGWLAFTIGILAIGGGR